ncbi:P-loop containing nucleoside triphosphate hydrolase protein [Kockovaella imperatae]|uniref:p-loop containing nucleoside triphosphate hydrolase protein n=1 Tax=Kockovaella imperatae TaxID=4999 RepID=A0A1Y1UA47_9TREE|nr:P-loop containing nucleoside triphosphate hydrolase protein [Kockovaella imperatae]ORX33955.1 P-loop containing nucleoside triphosphate hydrolase protein [Kockovaella imperatae]
MPGPSKRTRQDPETPTRRRTPRPTPPPTPLTRSNSQLTIPTRRSLGSHASLPSPGVFGGGTLVRTMSQPAILLTKPDFSKDDVPLHPGKENIPPRKDSESSSRRKRIRVAPRPRSGSVSSRQSDSRISSTPSFLSSRFSSPAPSSFTSSSDLDQPCDTPRSPRLALPTPPPSSPCEIDLEPINLDANPYKAIKSRLRLSNASGIIGRQEEQKAIREYVASTYKLDVGMYVSGPPGTGKTATVNAMARALGNEGWRPIEVCCMGLKANDLWMHFAQAMGCDNAENVVIAALQNTREPLLVILDEIDSVMPPAPAVAPPAISHLLSKIFSLPTTTDGRVKVIAISNTLDLTLRARLVLPDGATPSVLPFKAYGGQDMIPIVSSRIGDSIDPKALELLSKKVEAQNGDLRMCLSVLTSAVSLAEAEWLKKDTFVKVSLAHIIKAFTTYTLRAAAGSSATVDTVTGKKVRSVPLQGKMVLVAILIAQGPLSTTSLYTTYVSLLSHHSSPYPPSSESDYQDLLSNLEVLGLITCGPSRKLTLCCREEEIRDGLGLNSAKRGLAEDVVAKIWEREQARLRRASGVADL